MNENKLNNRLYILIFLLSLSAYPFFLMGFSRNSAYSTLGSFRGLAQVISYESVFFFVFILFIIIAETNRAPFDFAEGESELVRGYNIEYGSILFTIIFLREYLALLIISVIMSMIFLSRA